jgi:predicted GNAT family N-acyltransferase
MGKDDFRIHELPASRHGEALALLRAGGAYWIEHASDYTVLVSMRAPSEMIGAVDAHDRLVGCARILSDQARVAWIFDVMIDRALRGTGLGMQLMEYVLAHPSVRSVEKVRLGTRDAEAFYRKLGFIPVGELVRPYPSIDMIRVAKR